MQQRFMIRGVFAVVCMFAIAWFSVGVIHAQVSQISGGAVGFKVLPNPEHLPPLEWYKKYIPSSNQGTPRELVIDGYQAIEDGRSVYVTAANYVGGALYTNIYVFSYDANDPDGNTKEIFNRIVGTLNFTQIPGQFNPTGQGICSISGIACTSDFDCDFAPPTSETCQNISGEMIRRDTRRVGDLTSFSEKLRVFRNAFGSLPQLLAGSFVSGVSYSTWPSWRLTLSQALGENLPVDPINKFSCPTGTDPVTCWNVAQRIFACPIKGYSYVYQYASTTSGRPLFETGTFAANFETNEARTNWAVGSGVSIANCNNSFFLTTTNDVDQDGVPNTLDNCSNLNNPSQRDSDADGTGDPCDTCPYDAANDSDGDGFCGDVDNCPFIANTNQNDSDGDGFGDVCDATCGDGIINPAIGEQCDPLAVQTPPLCSTLVAGTFGSVTCNGSSAGPSLACKWNTTQCSAGTCGNGFVEPNEQCEPGNFEISNCTTPLGYPGVQRRNCTSSCTWAPYNQLQPPAAPGQTCAATGYCGDGFLQVPIEQCDNGSANGPTGTCDTSCNIQVCPNCGVTCGNGQPDSGEQCGDGLPLTSTCAGVGQSGGTTPISCITSQCIFDISPCTPTICGDGQITGGEECEPPGSTNTCTGIGEPFGGASQVTCLSGTCTWSRSVCAFTPNICGNGVVETARGEECDDGNGINTDGCTNLCKNDQDLDGVADATDNCLIKPNPLQVDTNFPTDDNASIAGVQHYGNLCDTDFNNDGSVGTSDFAALLGAFGSALGDTNYNPDIDCNSDGSVGTFDFACLLQYFGGPPGP